MTGHGTHRACRGTSPTLRPRQRSPRRRPSIARDHGRRTTSTVPSDAPIDAQGNTSRPPGGQSHRRERDLARITAADVPARPSDPRSLGDASTVPAPRLDYLALPAYKLRRRNGLHQTGCLCSDTAAAGRPTNTSWTTRERQVLLLLKPPNLSFGSVFKEAGTLSPRPGNGALAGCRSLMRLGGREEGGASVQRPFSFGTGTFRGNNR